ncbi:N-6 DNA methylase [Candidatus Poribacteria bacterium]|nr:N-6 DNA methylase [Candidatus Poribacteria bacterium]
METKPQYLTIKEAAELLGVTSTTLRNWDKSGKLNARRDPVNDYRLYAVEDVSKLLGERSGTYQSPASDTTAIQPLLFPLSSPPTSVKTTLDTRALRLLVRQMSRTFRDSMGGGLLERFEEISKLLYCKLYDERQSQTLASYKPCFYLQRDESLDETYRRITALYQSAISFLPDVLTNGYRKLSDDKKAVIRIVEILQDVSLSHIPTDVKGAVYEELVRNTFEKSDNQQFFTPRPVVEFMVQFLNPQAGQTLCDPACGSGGFLIEASKHIHKVLRKQMPEDLSIDGMGSLSNHIVGLEIDKRMAWVAQMNLIMHGNGHGNIHHLGDGGSLAFSNHLDALVRPNSLDLILTNPPFGSDFSDSKPLSRYQLGQGKSSRRRGILFIERCVGWLKPGGRLGIVIEDSVLNGASNTDVRHFILKHCIVEAVISLPDVTFMPYSSAKTSILFLRKRTTIQQVQPPIVMANVEQVGRKPNGDPLYAAGRNNNAPLLLQNELPDVVDAWQTYVTRGENAIAPLSPQIFVCPPDRFQEGSGTRLDVQFHHPSRRTAENTLHSSIYPTPKLAELVVVRNITAVPATQDPDEVWQYVGLANITAGTGEYTVSSVIGSQLKSTVRLFRPGDILFSKLRPELRKCVLIRDDEDEGFASSECLVFCTLTDAMRDPSLQNIACKRKFLRQHQIDREYLAFILRSDIVFGQLVYQITGVGRPRVSQSAILGLRIPLPPLPVQREIVAAYKMAWKHYLECRHRSVAALREGDEALRTAYTHTCERLCPTST